MIEEMAKLQKLIVEQADCKALWLSKDQYAVTFVREQLRELHEAVESALTAYNVEKELLKKTQEYHKHGMIAPTCVGCPTAEVVIEKKQFVGVDWRGMFRDLTDEEYAAVFKDALQDYAEDDDEEGWYLLEDDDTEDFVIRYHMALNKKRHEKNLEGSDDGT